MRSSSSRPLLVERVATQTRREGYRAAGPRAPEVAIAVFGQFEITRRGVAMDLTAVRPRVRTLLRLLAAAGGRPLHRDALQAALWPGVSREAGTHHVHVAISSLRRALEPCAGRAASTLVARDGDAYRLAVCTGRVAIDLVAFECDLAAGRRAAVAGDVHTALRCYQQGLDRYAGDVLPEDGDVDWVLGPRERCRLAAIQAAERVAEMWLRAGEPRRAAAAAQAGIAIDPYSDPLWHLSIRAHEVAGERLHAHRARAAYRRVLADLGLPSSPGLDPEPERMNLPWA